MEFTRLLFGKLLDVLPSCYLKPNSNTVMKVGILGGDIWEVGILGSNQTKLCN